MKVAAARMKMTAAMIRKSGVSLLASISSNTRLDLGAVLCTDWDVGW